MDKLGIGIIIMCVIVVAIIGSYLILDIMQLIKRKSYPPYVEFVDDTNAIVHIYEFKTRSIFSGFYVDYHLELRKNKWRCKLNQHNKEWLIIFSVLFGVALLISVGMLLIGDDWGDVLCVVGLYLYFTAIIFYFPMKACALCKKEARLGKTQKSMKELRETDFWVKNIIENDEKESDKPYIKYTILLEDDKGNEETIQTMDATYYEKKQGANEKVRIGTIRR